MANTPPTFSNECILQQLKSGAVKFELVSSPCTTSFLRDTNRGFFARIGQSLDSGSNAMKKLEHFTVQKVTGDGRCMFRALVKGMAKNKGLTLKPYEEKNDADELRMAVKEVLCENEKERRQYKDALVAITVDEPLQRYCQRIERHDFWGGEFELLVLSKLCHQPIIVYIPEREHTQVGRGSGFISIAEYGTEFKKGSKAKQVVRLLYSGRNHYDLLV